ncbi:MAG TPA: hypothetical protein VJJ22_02420 [Candidatus Paceibacterota bacterium]
MKDIGKKILGYLQERGWYRLRPANLAKSIMIEGTDLFGAHSV